MNPENTADSAVPSSALLAKFQAAIHRRVRYRITGGGILYFIALLLVGFASFLTSNNLLFLMFSAMLAILLVSGFLSRLMLSGLELELLLPEHVWARTPSPARVRLRNLKRITPSFSLELTGQRGRPFKLAANPDGARVLSSDTRTNHGRGARRCHFSLAVAATKRMCF